CGFDKVRGVYKDVCPEGYIEVFNNLNTNKELMNYYNVPYSTILRWNKELGISKKSNTVIDWELYHQLYHDKGFNLNEVANHMGISVNTLKGQMLKHKDKIVRRVDVWK